MVCGPLDTSYVLWLGHVVTLKVLSEVTHHPTNRMDGLHWCVQLLKDMHMWWRHYCIMEQKWMRHTMWVLYCNSNRSHYECIFECGHATCSSVHWPL